MAGRPHKTKPYKQRRLYRLGSRYEQRIQQLYEKKQKLEMLEALIWCHERVEKPDLEEIRKLKKRANEVRAQLTVLSTVDPNETKHIK